MIYIRIAGGLGNQLFEYAAARYLLYSTDGDGLVLDTTSYNCHSLRTFSLHHFDIVDYKKQNAERGRKYVNNYHVKLLYKLSELIDKKCSVKKKIVVERILKYPLQSIGIVLNKFSSDSYCKVLFSNKNIYMSGYFQSEDFFPGIRDILLEELQIKNTLLGEKKSFLDKIKASNAVCLHIRLGDYKKIKQHMICTKEYYKRSIKLIQKRYSDAKFFVFSDEVETVKKQFGFDEDNFYYEPADCKDYETLELMKNCNHFIMSNSSLSWWAQYLSVNNKKTVIAPAVWLNDTSYPIKIYQKDWVRLNVK